MRPVARLAASAIIVAVCAGQAAACDGTTGIVGEASYYCCEHHGRKTASGEVFNENALTAAMPNRAELGRSYRVTYRGKSVVVRINDVGPAHRLNRVIDLSRAAFAKLAPTSRGIINVCIERL